MNVNAAIKRNLRPRRRVIPLAIQTKDMIMSIAARFVIVAIAALTSASAASAQAQDLTYNSGMILSDIPDINSPEGSRAFWEIMQRNGD